ncbi:MAG: hypothetical protein ABIF77_20270, partial [bacterium]
MPFKLNPQGFEFGQKLIAMGAIDDGPTIPFGNWITDEILGDPPDWDQYGKFFLGIDPDGAGKEKYVYPIARPTGEGE